MSENQLDTMRGKVILLGKRAVVKMGKNRYIVYLPTSFNKVWSSLHMSRSKILVYVEIPANEGRLSCHGSPRGPRVEVR